MAPLATGLASAIIVSVLGVASIGWCVFVARAMWLRDQRRTVCATCGQVTVTLPTRSVRRVSLVPDKPAA